MALPPPGPGSTALVTGASSGIGRELARGLAARGHGVTLVARRAERLEDLADELRRSQRVEAFVQTCDLADAGARRAMLEDVAERGHAVEVLVNAAGFSTLGELYRLDPDREVAQVRTNVEAVVDLTVALLPAMVHRGRGAVLNVASTAAFQPMPRWATYAASKAFVVSWTEAVHAEVRPAGVTAVALCPGPVRTEFTQVGGITAADHISFLWSEADAVAEAGLRALERGRRRRIPGALPAAVAAVGRLAPRAAVLRVLRATWPAPDS